MSDFGSERVGQPQTMQDGARTARQCPATTLQKDERWGGFVLQCERPAGDHEVHQHAMNACEPTAILTWRGTYEADYSGSNQPLEDQP